MSAEEVVGETAADTTTTNSKSTEGKKVKKPNTIAEHLKSQKDEVTADKVLTNHIKTYVEGHKRMYLGITKRHGQVIIKADNYRLELLNTYPDLKEALKALFVDFEDDDEGDNPVGFVQCIVSYNKKIKIIVTTCFTISFKVFHN